MVPNKETVSSRVNLALGKETYTNHSESDSYVDSCAVDGDLSKRWGSLPSGDAWLQVDLEELSDISGIMLYLESAYVPYYIEYSTDGEEYSSIYSGAANEVFVLLEDLDISARYIRIRHDGSNWFSIYELKVYG